MSIVLTRDDNGNRWTILGTGKWLYMCCCCGHCNLFWWAGRKVVVWDSRTILGNWGRLSVHNDGIQCLLWMSLWGLSSWMVWNAFGIVAVWNDGLDLYNLRSILTVQKPLLMTWTWRVGNPKDLQHGSVWAWLWGDRRILSADACSHRMFYLKTIALPLNKH